MGACISSKKGKNSKFNENAIVKYVIIDYCINDIEFTQIDLDKNKSINQLIKSTSDNIDTSTYNDESSTNYYLLCPDCSIRSPHIEKFCYDNKVKDFLVKYT